MRFQLLGPLSICDTSDTVVLQPSKPTNLLAALLLHSNTVVSADFLQRMVWGDEQPATAKAALQTCVLRLRRLFQRHGVTDTSIEAVPGGYRITADPRTLDLLEFRAYVTAADHGGDAEEQLRSLRSALALWQGSVLANVRSEPVQRDLVPQLSEERLHVVERVCDLELALGRCSMVLGDLWGATRAHPDHGRFREQLIEALYRTGRQAEALAEYRRVKQYLSDELGVDPSPALQQLELAILRGEDLGPTTGPGTRPAVRGEVVRLPLPAAEAPTPGDGVRRVVTASGAAGGEPAAVAEHPAAVPARPAGPERAAVAGPAAAEGRLRAAEDAPRGPGGTPAGAVGLRLATEPPAGADPGVPRARRAGDDADHQSIDQRTADQRTADHHAADHRVADHHPADRPAAPDRPAERRAGADAPTGRHTGAVAGAHHTAPRHRPQPLVSQPAGHTAPGHGASGHAPEAPGAAAPGGRPSAGRPAAHRLGVVRDSGEPHHRSAAEPPAAGRTGPAGTEDLRGPYEPFEPSELPADHTAPSAPSAQPGPSDARPGEGEAEVVPLPTPAQPPAGASRPPHHAAPPAPPLTVSGAVHPRGPSGALRPAGPVPAFAGREDALAAIAGRLAAATATATTGDGPADPPAPELICGAPGVGKTALAREVASRLDSAFPGGRWLLPMTLPDGTPRAAAHAAAELSAAFAAESPRGVLLVLDDVTDAEQVRPLLPLGPGCAVLVTSRRGLAGLVATHGGTVHRVQPLAPVDSARLLTAALGADRAGREPGAVTELAEGCGHHPLALRVAAARLLTRPALSLADGARWLAQDARACLSLPGDPSMSVSTVLDTAVGRLSPELRALFHRLATAPGPEVHPAPPPAPGGPEPTPEQPAPTEPALEQLADAGLLEDGPPGPYRMHPLLRRYARWAAPGPGRHPVDPDSVRPTDRCE